MSRKPRKRADGPWRVSVGGQKSPRVHHEGAAEFDEIVVGDWLHVEQMSDRHYWVVIGGVNINVFFNQLGRVQKVNVEEFHP